MTTAVSDRTLAKTNRLDARELKTRIDLVVFAGQFTRLRRSGRQFLGLCPLHPERHPSFYVHPDKQVFHCFGCGAGGDLFAFVMRATGCDFRRALEIVAEFCAGVARASESRSGSRLGMSEGAKPLSPPKAGALHNQSAGARHAQILEALAETDRRLVRVAITNAAASAALATACEPERSSPFTCQKPDNSP